MSYKIGIDIGSTYTKYCVANQKNEIVRLFSERTPVRQREYFEKKIKEINNIYPEAQIVSCGYGKKNVLAVKRINELTALAKGSYFFEPDVNVILDIGGQDTKVIYQQDGKLNQFFINDRCAAGSGMFLLNICKLLEKNLEEVDLCGVEEPNIKLSSVCAVFAQSEIVELIADNVSEEKIINAVIWQMLIQAKRLIDKVNTPIILLSGGLTQIKGIDEYIKRATGLECIVNKEAIYYSAIGCTLN